MGWDKRQSRWRGMYKGKRLQIRASELIVRYGLSNAEPNYSDTVVAANRWFRQEQERIDRENVSTTFRPFELEHLDALENIRSSIKPLSALARNPALQSVLTPIVETLKRKESLILQELRKPVLSPLDDRLRSPLHLSPEPIEKDGLQQAKQIIADRLRSSIPEPSEPTYEDVGFYDIDLSGYSDEGEVRDAIPMLIAEAMGEDMNRQRQAYETLIQNESERLVNIPGESIDRKKQEVGAIGEFERGIATQLLTDMGENLTENRQLDYHIDKFLECQQRRCAEGQIKVGRLEKIRNTIKTYRNWSSIVRVDKIGTKEHIEGYRRFLSDKVIAEEWKPKYANDLFSGLKMLIQWLFDEEVLKEYPACLKRKGNKYSFTVPLPTPQTVPLEWVHKLLESANPRLKLYILLALNCGFVGSDIGQLTVDKYDAKAGRITYKRKKTEQFKNVPTVCYKLWDETKALLDNEIAANKKKYPKPTKYLLINENGSPLWTEYIDKDGKTHKSDNIVSAFKRLVSKLRKDNPDMPSISFKQFRKTSSTLIRNDKVYAMYAWLFLGHTPQTTGDKFYNALDITILDDTIAWLHDKVFDFVAFPEAENATMDNN